MARLNVESAVHDRVNWAIVLEMVDRSVAPLMPLLSFRSTTSMVLSMMGRCCLVDCFVRVYYPGGIPHGFAVGASFPPARKRDLRDRLTRQRRWTPRWWVARAPQLPRQRRLSMPRRRCTAPSRWVTDVLAHPPTHPPYPRVKQRNNGREIAGSVVLLF